MVRKPKNYKIGNMVYFIFHDLPHTGIIKYIHKDTFEIEDMTFIDIMDKDTAEIPKNDCIKTGEIYLPKYPDNAQRKMVKVFDKNRLQYEAFPKRRIVNGTLLSPIIEFDQHSMIFLLNDNKWYIYRMIKYNGYYYPALIDDNDNILICKWIYQKSVNIYDSSIFEKFKTVDESNIVAILEKDKRYDQIYENMMLKGIINRNELKLHFNIIYRIDHDCVNGLCENYDVPYKHICGIYADSKIYTL